MFKGALCSILVASSGKVADCNHLEYPSCTSRQAIIAEFWLKHRELLINLV